MDARLLRKLITLISDEGDMAAYKKLFLLYHLKLLNFSMSILHSRELAEEVVSDVFIKIWTLRTSLVAIENFHLYIYIITKNLSINMLLKQRREQSFSLDEIAVEIEDIHFDPEQLLITAETEKEITSAIQALPPRCRLIFKLIKEDGLKHREVAELLNLSQKTVENQVTIALKKITEFMRFTITRNSN
ncbi:MAG: RNA polymerase sigma-70 factor [Flavisolibacter sp.]